MNHLWQPINRMLLGMVVADCGSAAARFCPSCDYFVCSLQASCDTCLPLLEGNCRPPDPPTCENEGCQRVLDEGSRVNITDPSMSMCGLCTVRLILANTIAPDVELQMTAESLHRLLMYQFDVLQKILAER